MIRISVLLLSLSLTFGVLCLPASAATDRLSADVIGAGYDPELYELAYKVFMFNSNNSDAYRLSVAALKSRPKDRVWRRRAVQTAEWSGQPEKALEHLAYLALFSGDRTAMQKALDLSEGLGALETRRELLAYRLKQGGDIDTMRRLLEVNELSGVPEESISLLERLRNGPDRQFKLLQLPALYQAVGRPLDAIGAINEYAESFTMTTELFLLRARIMYGRRDFEGVWKGLKEGMGNASPADVEYWQELSDICWFFQDPACVTTASGVLAGSGAGREEDYYRLSLVNQVKDPALSYDFALQGWRRFMKPVFFITLFETGLELGRHEELLDIMENLNYEESNSLLAVPYAWRLRSEVYRKEGMPDQCIDSYRYSLAFEPDNLESVAGFIWLLIDLDRDRELRRTIDSFELRYRGRYEIFDALGAGYAHLGDYSRGVKYYRLNYGRRNDDPLWLAAYADLLEQSYKPEEAIYERLRAFRLVRKGISPVNFQGDRALLDVLKGRLMMTLRPGDAADAAVKEILDSSADDVSSELMTAWALSSERNDLARLLLWRKFGRFVGGPVWARFSLALEETDKYIVSDMLTQKIEKLPYRDAVEGAQRTGDTPLAADHAFRWFERNSDDQLLDNQFRDLAQEHHEEVAVGGKFQDFGAIRMVSGFVRGARHLSNRVALFAATKYSVFGRSDDNVVGLLPDRDISGDIELSTLFSKGRASVSVGGRSSLNDFPYFSVATEYRPTSGSSVSIDGELSGTPEETAMLQIGGVRDRVSLGITNGITRRDTVYLRGAIYSLRDQWRRPLASGESIEADIAHRTAFAYPDMLVRAFGGYYRYQSEGTPSGETLSLLPSGSQADSGFFIPQSFFQTGVGISAGSIARERYSRNWQPYGEVDLIWNSRSDIGFRYDLGLAGPLLGMDRLNVGVGQDSGRFGGSDINTSIGVTYGYHFN